MSATPQATPIPLIMGPTGAGKTDLALRLAARYPIEIVSVDSALVYRGMDIGTGKPSREELERFPHHLVDILDPSQPYSAGQFVRDALHAIGDIRKRGNLPVLVGGTMLYFRALRRGLAEMPQADPGVRQEIDAEAARSGWPALHAQLAALDPATAQRIQPNDGQRIQRALEVHRLTGKTLSELHAQTRPADPAMKFAAFAWAPSDRERLYQAIERRFERMMQAGFLDEVRGLQQRGDLHADLPAIRSVGYRQLWEHLCGKASLTASVQRAIFATRQLARRQLIWLRAEDDMQWCDALDSTAADPIENAVATFVRGMV
ncbi:tRNA dimethylallyltransferase [Steroidobacter agaridevorans]|uniref:tRNA dimethylallyltransferase n=1 Tax=Steroidobacter agaridevorans TaxID=2695856 RepID=A0A829YNS8_9GAMM|nr:tRNA (adenosine(37)-N6)-dimethylallyltransferase MiaA [Steroidobacter agaridevorans]GFE84492.1 tRNA dimethylallyltransferase [Steroidobacter agaridevorans]GFE90891.1 tRNA dimethylallyltransferase [Steroidobacter agaridevorans]